MASVALLVAFVLASNVFALSMTMRRRGLAMLYWAACSAMSWIGTIGLVYVVSYPPEYFDDQGNLIGEMPMEFGLALGILALGLLGTLVGFAVIVLTRIYQRHRPGRTPRHER